MSTKKKTAIDYRAIKKALSKYFEFSFKTPRGKKDFTPQQKSAISRKYRKIFPYIDGNFKPNTDEITFLKYPKDSKLPHVDGVRTDTGIFYKWPKAEVKRSRLEKKWLVVINPTIKKGAVMIQKRRDIFFPFPDSVITDINRVKKYVAQLVEKYKPHDIMWAIKEKRERVQYDPELFDLYFSQSFLEETDEEILESDEYNELDSVEKGDIWKRRKMRQKHEDMPDYYIGVFFVYYLNTK